MKIRICDVCLYEKNKLTEAKYRSGFTNTQKVDLCVKHRSFTKGLTRDSFIKKLLDLMDKKKLFRNTWG